MMVFKLSVGFVTKSEPSSITKEAKYNRKQPLNATKFEWTSVKTKSASTLTNILALIVVKLIS